MAADLLRVLGSLSLEGEELGEVIVPDIAYDKVEENFQFSMIGRVLTQKRFHVPSFKELVKSLWGGEEGMQIVDMGENLFHFVFVDGSQMARVLQGEPWLFRGSAILLKQWFPGMQAVDMIMDSIPCWVQVWNLPLGFVSEDFGKAIGAHIGELMEVDKRGIEQERGRYVRVRVRLDISKPLKRGGFLPLRFGRVKVVYRYEKLCDVCLYCGFLGHDSTNCIMRVDDEAGGMDRGNKFDNWLLVHGERRNTPGRRWDDNRNNTNCNFNGDGREHGYSRDSSIQQQGGDWGRREMVARNSGGDSRGWGERMTMGKDASDILDSTRDKVGEDRHSRDTRHESLRASSKVDHEIIGEQDVNDLLGEATVRVPQEKPLQDLGLISDEGELHFSLDSLRDVNIIQGGVPSGGSSRLDHRGRRSTAGGHLGGVLSSSGGKRKLSFKAQRGGISCGAGSKKSSLHSHERGVAGKRLCREGEFSSQLVIKERADVVVEGSKGDLVSNSSQLCGVEVADPNRPQSFR